LTVLQVVLLVLRLLMTTTMVSPEVTLNELVVKVEDPHAVQDTIPGVPTVSGPLKLAVMVPLPWMVAVVEAEVALVNVIDPVLDVHLLK
jgi:carbon monoxide dehydrogenase subunit G